jgi:hypothetical protein
MAARAARVVRGALAQVLRASPARAMVAVAVAAMAAGGGGIAAVAVAAVRRAA